jgi:nicotinamide phosphoribosyltransferase
METDFLGCSAIELTDGYKLDHRRQMPKEARKQFNTATPRKCRIPHVKKAVWVGQQLMVKRFLGEVWDNTFFKANIDEIVVSYTARVNAYLGPNTITFEHIRALHKLGFLPLTIKALPEGSLVPMRVAPMTYTNTEGHENEFAWLVGYLETFMSAVMWPPATDATIAYEHKKIHTHWALKTVGNADFVPFQGHDFSFRGMFGPEAAILGGLGHAVCFRGSDTFPMLGMLKKYYNANYETESVVHSVAATEHSVMCIGTGLYIYNVAEGDWDKIGDAEFSVFKRLITEVYPTGIISIVSDTFNLWKVLTEFLPALKAEILARDGKVVIRPDSGDPVDIICGLHNKDGFSIRYRGADPIRLVDHQTGAGRDVTEEEIKGVVELLWDIFGGTVTEKGYKLLDSHVGTIYGDSINTERAWSMNARLAAKGYASINWVAGIGSYSYQFVTRDTLGWAIKATYAEAVTEDGRRLEIPVFKDPITDDGTKKSARGLIRVEKDDEFGFVQYDEQTWEQEAGGELQVIFHNGVLHNEISLSEIRTRLDNALEKEIEGIEEAYKG